MKWTIQCLMVILFVVVGLTEGSGYLELLGGNMTTSVTWTDPVMYGERASFVCQTLSSTIVNVTHTWVFPNGSSVSHAFRDKLCDYSVCSTQITIPGVEFDHQGNYTCQSELGEIVAYLEVESLCPHARYGRHSGSSPPIDILNETSAFDCMKRCENHSSCLGITYIEVTDECWLHNTTEKSPDACEGDLLGYFYTKTCSNTSCSIGDGEYPDSVGTGGLLLTTNTPLDDCKDRCINDTACLGIDYNRNNNQCRLYDSALWTEQYYWARQGNTQCDFYRKVSYCYPVIECFPPLDLMGWEYRGKQNVSLGGVCKPWTDTRFSYLNEHENFCRKILSNITEVSCISAIDNDIHPCGVEACVQVHEHNVDVIYGNTATFVINVTWFHMINVTHFQWKKSGMDLSTNDSKYIIGSIPLSSLTVLNTTFEDEDRYILEIYTEIYDIAEFFFHLRILGGNPYASLHISPNPAILGKPLSIVCKLKQPPSPNILKYSLRRKRESDLIPEILTVMPSNETFDNTSDFVARFDTPNVTILDYSQYKCTTENLIAKQRTETYLDLNSGESELSGFVYIPELDKVLKPFEVNQMDNSGSEIHCQSLNGTLLMITSLERQIYIEKMLREMWPGSSGIAYISGKYVNSNWMINETVAIFTYWNESFPQDESARDCLAQNLDPPYRWMNIPCSQHLPYICELQPFCNEPNVTNATASSGSTYIFTQRPFSCSDSKKASPHLVCKEDLQWHGGCEPIICPFEEGVNSHPIMNKTYYYNETVEYVCNEGFKMESGSSVLVCGSDESWNGLPLNCSAIECEIVNISNAQILTANLTTMMPFESTIEYECYSGFILSSGDYKNTCSGTGNWTNLPTCSLPFCPNEEINSTVYIVNRMDGYWTADNMSLACNNGYRHGGGALNRTCEANGTWSSPLPICTQCKCPCDRVHPVQNPTIAELNEKIEQMKKELLLNTRTLSSSVRKRTSAKDDRPSATGVGVVLGIGIFTLLFAAVIVPDIPSLVSDIRNSYAVKNLLEYFRQRGHR
ncbi:uncharacterized protein LOC111107483 [Crassostrea virginica]